MSVSLTRLSCASIIDMLQSDIDYPMELWREKLGDAKNYMILIECLVEEEKNEEV